MGSALSWTPGLRETEEIFQIFYTSAVTRDEPSHSSSYISFTAHSAEGWMGPKANLYAVVVNRPHSLTSHLTGWSKESSPGKKSDETWTRLQVLARRSRLITIQIYIMRFLIMIYLLTLLVAQTDER
jgi:hypothetical protein